MCWGHGGYGLLFKMRVHVQIFGGLWTQQALSPSISIFLCRKGVHGKEGCGWCPQGARTPLSVLGSSVLWGAVGSRLLLGIRS